MLQCKRGDFVLKALIVINSKNKKTPFSTRLIDVCKILSKKNYDIKIELTKKINDTFNIVNENKKKYNLLVVAGGDGTINEVSNALQDDKNKPIIMYFPTGTVNDFGTSLKIPHKFDKQLQVLNRHNTMKVDTGKVNDKYFNYICAFGPFTRASYTTPHSEKNRFGKWAYYRHVIEEIPMLNKSYHLEVEIDGEKISGLFTSALIINSTSIGGFRHFMKHDSINDGYFNLVLVSKANARMFKKGIKHLINGMKDNVKDEDYIFKKFKKLKIITSENIPWTLDGEKGPVGSVEIEVIKHNLEIIVP